MFPLSDRRNFVGGGDAAPESVDSMEMSSLSGIDVVSPDKKRKQNKRKPVYVRKEFPETWLWTEEMVK